MIKLFVEEALSNNEKTVFNRAYQLKDIRKVADLPIGVSEANASLSYDTSATVHSIADLHALVKTYDEVFSPKSVNPILLNEDGTPRIFYHGTRPENGEFYEFDYTKAKVKGGLGFKALGKGNYFTSKKLDGTERYGSRVLACYLSIQRPFLLQTGPEDIYAQFERKTGIHVEGYDALQSAMREAGYDGVISHGANGHVIAVTFDSAQTKSATDNIGTFDPKNPDIRYSIRRPTDASEAEGRAGERAATRTLESLIGDMSFRQDERKWLTEYGAVLDEVRADRVRVWELGRRAQELRGEMAAMSADIRRLVKSREDEELRKELTRARRLDSDALDTAKAELKDAREALREDEATLRALEVSDMGDKLLRVKRVVDTANERVEKTKQVYTVRAERQKARSKKSYDAMMKYHLERHERTKAKHKERLEKVYRKNKEKLDKLREADKQWRESFERGEKRRVIFNTYKRWIRLLEHPTKHQNIPKAVQGMVADMIAVLNVDTVQATKRMAALEAKIEAELQKEAPDFGQIRIWETAMSSIQNDGHSFDHFREKVQRLYARIKASKDPRVREYYSEDVKTALDGLDELLDGRSISEMTLEELRSVKKVMDMVVHSITMYQNRLASLRGATVEAESRAIQAELGPAIDRRRARRKLPGTDGRDLKFLTELKGAYFNEFKPIYFFDEIESPTLRKLFDNLYVQGEGVAARDLLEVKAFKREMVKKYGADTWDMKQRIEVKTNRGMIKLTLGQLLSVYAHSRREQAMGHLSVGGFCIDPREESTVSLRDGKLKLPLATVIDDAVAYRVTQEQLLTMLSKLTDRQRGYVEEMTEFLSTVMADKGNEVSLKQYGIDLFTEEHYFPIKTKSEYRAQLDHRDKGAPMLKSLGMTKPVKPEAANPLVLSDFDSAWAGHCADMTSYHALVLPLEDLRRVFEYGSTDSEVGANSTKGAITNAYGEAATRYISRLITDLNGGVRMDTTAGFTGKLISLMKKSRVMGSLSVVVQQPLAAVRAMALIHPKYFTTTDGFKVGKDFSEQWGRMMKYADTAALKDMGFFEVGVGLRTTSWINQSDYKGASEKAAALIKDADYRDEVLAWGASTADKMAWMQIWAAAEAEVANTQGGLKHGSEAFYEAVGARFDEVVRRTQVYDSILSRSGFMRDTNPLVQMATAFMAEPTTTVNMLIATVRSWKNGQRRAVGQTVGAVVASLILNAMLVAAVYAMRDDDEDETYGEKYVESVSNQLRPWTLAPNMIPFVRDVVSLCEGYDIERTDMTVVGDLVDAFRALESKTKSPYEKTEAFVGSIGTLFGLPARNLMRDTRAVMQTLAGGTSGESETGTASGTKYALMSGLFGTDVSNGQQMYEALMSGDTAHYNRVVGRYETEAQAKVHLRRAIRDNDPRIAEAADARIQGNTAEAIRIREAIVAERHFKNEDVLAAVNAEVNTIKKLEEES